MLNYLASEVTVGMQNVYTPLSTQAHFVFCLFSTVLYLVQFYRKGSWHYLLIMTAIDLTFATQTSLCTTSTAITVLGAIEVILLATAAYFYAQFAKKEQAAKAAREQELDEQASRQRAAEIEQRKKDERPVDNAFEDEDI